MKNDLEDIRKNAISTRDRLLKDSRSADKWRFAFEQAGAEEPLFVVTDAPERDYFIIEFRQGNRTTGLMIANANTGRVGSITGIQTPTESMYRFYRPTEILEYLEGRKQLISRRRDFLADRIVVIKRERVTLQANLYWEPCDQSLSPFQPFYVVHLRNVDEVGAELRLFVRVDGELSLKLTHTGAGM